MDTGIYRDILKKYWGFNEFRPLQESIINSVGNGRDTLALMPTGGGKSLTFQVPALAKEGICLVITPLIALMKDQVARLNSLSIKSLAIHSGMFAEEIDNTIENAIYGNYKFLYVSPERLATKDFAGRASRLNLSMIAVDEAHCISQWGYDFRPSYLKIAGIREVIREDVPVLALTATATSHVIDDIMDKLEFRERNVLRTSFNRKNLIYLVRKVEDKRAYLLNTVKKASGSGIIYVRSRKKAAEIAGLLRDDGISSDFYHAGLSDELRDIRQEKWTHDKIRVIVATNAFGMGIDKPDVRFVIHWDVPDSIENYFQESGRAGRDGKQSSAVLLFSSSDKSRLSEAMRKKFPAIEKIKDIYEVLCNYLQVPLGSGKEIVYDFRMSEFISKYRLPVTETINSLQFLQREGYIEFTEEINNPSRVHFIVSRDDLYKFQVANEAFDSFIKLLLRSYTGMFSEFVPVNEDDLARKSGADRDTIYRYLVKLSSFHIIRYIPGKRTSLIIFREERLSRKALRISAENYHHVKERYTERLNRMIDYAESDDRCRSIMLLNYFDEESEPCEKCDVCRKKSDVKYNAKENDNISAGIIEILKDRRLEAAEIAGMIPFPQEKVIQTLRWLLDSDKIRMDKDNKLYPVC
ncbi:MAG TPA: ATP-dependent DNA helicase RecQ [Bacteroidales bacterium]|nr:ATP-dependent DNA helicase RecQ [Bacteroidales bacterium]